MVPSTATGSELRRLMVLAQSGDEAAYADLLNQVAAIARAVIRNRVRTFQATDVEDVVQDVLMAIHMVRATYDPARPFMPWLMTILQSRLVDRLRKLQRIASNETAVDALPELPHFGQDGWSAEAYGDAEHLRREIGGLPATQRRAIEMLKLRELSLKEASAESGLSTANLKVLVHRAIKTLRSRLVASHDA
ncbi:RNA polymerase, sigma-24 subunit, ECF subfamily [Methylobacterium radiotolerans JCM 2831]|uniref:RNA polymerase, sigma-24 subunit, ECF subfamily n=2 Tax=Methylobacterium TaxID=407 RepID=B1M103_METRJ|nr:MULTISPECIES: sigma-70 family RNA polymerase sigma factor [Methylobacteriaceae]ACB24553.1 RNA polymerase, sigma-24 subunit, ECF subfamily [Methylobacterium radiotolerans JCM 2831]GEN01650.1 DNA-directed RNA polymerase sigma-70 factor [Methylobacterium radiotolerans]